MSATVTAPPRLDLSLPLRGALGRARTWHWQGHACHWRVLGQRAAPALVLIHGFGAASGHWRSNSAALAEAGWCVYALDLVGFGDSSQPRHRRHRPLDNRLWARSSKAFSNRWSKAPRCS